MFRNASIGAILLIWCVEALAETVSERFFGYDLLLIPGISWVIWFIFAAVGIILRYDMESSPPHKGAAPVHIPRRELGSMIVRGLFAGFIAFGLCEQYGNTDVGKLYPMPGTIQCAIISISAWYSRDTIRRFKSAVTRSTEGMLPGSR